MLGADFSSRGWPQCGEIDIVEMGHKTATGNNTQERYFTGAAHWGTQRGSEHPNYALSAISPYSLQDDFHLYTLLWDETGIRMYLDENPQPYFVMDTTTAAVKNFFHKPYFIVFNLAVGGDLPQIYDGSLISALNANNNYEARMYIDFLNVYDTSGNPLWQTEFDDQTLDSGRWNIEEDDRGGGNHELQSYRQANAFLGTEPETGRRCLILSAKKQQR
jgi:beta-glucanase (GH16 family)